MRKVLLATVAACGLAFSAPAHAQLGGLLGGGGIGDGTLVFDPTVAARALSEINWLKQQFTQLTSIFGSVAHGVNVIGMAPGLTMLQNPIGNIAPIPGSIAGIGGIGGLGGGLSGLAQQFLTQGQVYRPQGNDFTANWLNQRSDGLANSQALAYQYMQASQARIQNLDELSAEAQAATDVQQMSGIQARIAVEQQYLTSQEAQAQQVLGLAKLQEMVANQQLAQNWRQGNDNIVQQTQAAADSLGVGNLFTGAGSGGVTGPVATTGITPSTVSFQNSSVPVFGSGG